MVFSCVYEQDMESTAEVVCACCCSIFTDIHTSHLSNHFKFEEILVSALYMNPVMINVAHWSSILLIE